MNITIKFGKKILFTTKKEKIKELDHPTKEEFYNRVNEIQKKELESNKFKTISIFMKNHDDRINRDLEEQLFSIVGNYGFEDESHNRTYDENKLSRISRFNEFKYFIDSLNQEQIESNPYLKAAHFFMQTSKVDCENIISDLRKQMESTELTDMFKIFRFEIEIPEETQKMLPIRISEQKGIPFYKPEVYKTEFVNLLPADYQYIYTNYNNYASKIDKLASDIYFLQMWNLLSKYEEHIDNNYFNIYNNCFEHKFLVGCFVRKNKISKQVSKTKEKLVYEEIKDELNKFLDETIGAIEIDEVDFDLEDSEISIDEVHFDETDSIVSIDEVELEAPKLSFKKD